MSRGGVAQTQIVSPQHDGPAPVAPKFIDRAGEAFPGVQVPGVAREGKLAAEEPGIDVGKFQRHHAQAHAAGPGFAEQFLQISVGVGFKVAWLAHAFGALPLVAVVVADFHGERADAAALLAHLREQPVSHAAKHGFDVLLVGHVLGKGLLLAERLLRLALSDDGALVNAVGKLPEEGRLAAENEAQEFDRSAGNLPDVGEPGGVQAQAGLGTDAREPFVGERMQEPNFPTVRDVEERGGFIELGGDLADKLVGPDALAHGNLEFLGDGLADDLRDFGAGLLVVGGQVKIALVNRSALHVRGEVVGIREHPFGKILIALVIPGQHDELRAELAGAGGGHGGVHPELPGLIGGRGDDAPALTADGDRLAAQTRVGRLFHGGEEGVGVEMGDGSHLHRRSILAYRVGQGRSNSPTLWRAE